MTSSGSRGVPPRPSSVRLTRYHAVSPLLRDPDTGDPVRVLFVTRSGEVRYLSEMVWSALVRRDLATLDTATLMELVDIEALVPSNEDELATMLARSDAAAADGSTLYMVVQPTAACQLGCGYCGQEHTAARMTDLDQRMFAARIRSRLAQGSFDQLHIGWFGAEPLLGLSVMRSLTARLRNIVAKGGVGYSSKVVTNGLELTGEVARELVENLGVVFIEVTLDGPAEFHDGRRHWKGGHPSFDRIFDNLCAVDALDLDVQLSVRSNVDRSNAEGVEELMRLLADAGLADRVRFYLAPVHSWGNDAHLRSFSGYEFSQLEASWLARQIELGFTPSLLPGLKPVVCMATTPHSELVDAFGNLFNCTEVSYVPSYGVPNEWQIGHVATAEVAGSRARLGDWNRVIEQGEVPCKSCRMLPVCGGSCPKQWLEGMEPCPPAKYNIAERLVLAYAQEKGLLQRRIPDDVRA